MKCMMHNILSVKGDSMVEVVRILRKKATNRYYLVNISTGKKKVISKTGALKVCEVFNVEVEPFDVCIERKSNE